MRFFSIKLDQRWGRIPVTGRSDLLSPDSSLNYTEKKNGAILNQREFRGLKKDFSIVDNLFENDYETFLRVSIFETKWFGMAPFFFSVDNQSNKNSRL